MNTNTNTTTRNEQAPRGGRSNNGKDGGIPKLPYKYRPNNMNMNMTNGFNIKTNINMIHNTNTGVNDIVNSSANENANINISNINKNAISIWV